MKYFISDGEIDNRGDDETEIHFDTFTIVVTKTDLEMLLQNMIDNNDGVS